MAKNILEKLAKKIENKTLNAVANDIVFGKSNRRKRKATGDLLVAGMELFKLLGESK